MAHLPVDMFPDEFDVVVEGTGMTQSIVAAALARAGKRVLHVDSNAFYGEHWATLMHKDLERWIAELTGNKTEENTEGEPLSDIKLDDGEELVKLNHVPSRAAVHNVVTRTEEEEKVETGREYEKEAVENVTDEKTEEPVSSECLADKEVSPASLSTDQASETVQTGQTAADVAADDSSANSGGHVGENVSANEAGETEGGAGEGDAKEQSSTRITWRSLLESDRRRFNYDIMPKMLYCRGQLVNTITYCRIARYLEFKAVHQMLTYFDNRLVQVPCSRSEVFSSKIVSMLEKRKMMKFLTFCAEYDQHPDEYMESRQQSFGEFLRSRELTPNLVQFIMYCIAMVDEDTPTIEGLKSCQTFLNSLGRFGNAPFLYPIFGSGELPQSFCRLCAVFGGVYCLKMSVCGLVLSQGEEDSEKTSSKKRCTGVVCTNGQKISCSIFISSASRLKEIFSLENVVRSCKYSRGIFITDAPISNADQSVSLITFPPHSVGPEQANTVTILQLGVSTYNTAERTFMVHMRCKSYGTSAEHDLESVARKVFKFSDSQESCCDGPNILWSVFFNLDCTSVDPLSYTPFTPANVHVVSDPDGSIGYEQSVDEARNIFKNLCPDDEFLPPMPDPDNIDYYTTEEEGEKTKEATDTKADDSVEEKPAETPSPAE